MLLALLVAEIEPDPVSLNRVDSVQLTVEVCARFHIYRQLVLKNSVVILVDQSQLGEGRDSILPVVHV